MAAQFDWVGCPVCGGDMPFSFGGGRPASYCSDACKMKAYRQRQKNVTKAVPLQAPEELTPEQLARESAIDAYNVRLSREHVEGDTYILFGLQVVKHWAAGWKVQELVRINHD